MLLLLLPVSLYFYVFHGDWFMLYTFDVRRVPSALALFGFAVELAVGLLGFRAAPRVRAHVARELGDRRGGRVRCACSHERRVRVPRRLRVVGTFGSTKAVSGSRATGAR